MKIALTGASSVGKTYLSDHLMANKEFTEHISKFITPNARKILDSMGHSNTDVMTRKQLRDFQLKYFAEKLSLEVIEVNFLTERSFVDVEAFWEVRDTYDQDIDIQNKIKDQCKFQSRSYDLHFYLPFGLIPFESDGYRSEDIEFHKNIDIKIKSLLTEWNIKYVKLDMVDINSRVNAVIDKMEKI